MDPTLRLTLLWGDYVLGADDLEGVGQLVGGIRGDFGGRAPEGLVVDRHVNGALVRTPTGLLSFSRGEAFDLAFDALTLRGRWVEPVGASPRRRALMPLGMTSLVLSALVATFGLVGAFRTTGAPDAAGIDLDAPVVRWYLARVAPNGPGSPLLHGTPSSEAVAAAIARTLAQPVANAVVVIPAAHADAPNGPVVPEGPAALAPGDPAEPDHAPSRGEGAPTPSPGTTSAAAPSVEGSPDTLPVAGNADEAPAPEPAGVSALRANLASIGSCDARFPGEAHAAERAACLEAAHRNRRIAPPTAERDYTMPPGVGGPIVTYGMEIGRPSGPSRTHPGGVIALTAP